VADVDLISDEKFLYFFLSFVGGTNEFSVVFIKIIRKPVCSFNMNCRIRFLLQYYRSADKSLARPGRKQSTATEDFDFHISYL